MAPFFLYGLERLKTLADRDVHPEPMDQRSAVGFGVLRSLERDERRGGETKATVARHSTDEHHRGRGDRCPASLGCLAISVAGLTFSHSNPADLWAYGNENCFLSHSTLICLIVAIGLHPLHRKIGAILIAFVLVAISLPQIYVGGHYPIDVAASAVFAVACYWRGARFEFAGASPDGMSWAASRGLL